MKIVIKINPLDCKMNKKILIVTEYFYPNDSSTAYYLTDIVKTISDKNNVITITTSELNGSKELPFLKNKIFRMKESRFSKDRLLSRVAKLLFSTARLTWKAFSLLRKGDEIFAVTNPAFLILILAVIKKIKKVKYTLLVYDVFPENILAAGLTKSDSFIYKVSKKIFNWAYTQADHLIVIGRDMQEVIGLKTKNSVPLSLVTNWCDVESIRCYPKSANAIIQQFKLEEKIVFAFTGNFGRVQGIQNLLDATLLVKNKNFVLLFIGDGAMRSTIEEHIVNNSNKNVIYGGNYPASDKNIFLNACDIALVSLSPSMYGLGVPSKSYYNMAASKPLLLIGDERSEIGRVIKEHDIGWVVESDNPQKLAEQFEEICKNSSFDIKGRKSREVVEQFYSKEVILEKYKKLYGSAY